MEKSKVKLPSSYYRNANARVQQQKRAMVNTLQAQVQLAQENLINAESRSAMSQTQVFASLGTGEDPLISLEAHSVQAIFLPTTGSVAALAPTVDSIKKADDRQEF